MQGKKVLKDTKFSLASPLPERKVPIKEFMQPQYDDGKEKEKKQ